MPATIVMRCDCAHEDQDQIYGKGLRLHNIDTKNMAMCTVCVPNWRISRMITDVARRPVRRGKSIR